MDILSNLTNLLGGAAGAQQQGGAGGGLGALMGMLGGGGASARSGAAFGGGGGDSLGGLGSLVGALLGGGGGRGGASALSGLSGLAGMVTGGGGSGGGLGGLGSLIGSLMGGQGASMLGSLLGGEQAPPAPQAGIGDPAEAQAVNTLRALVYAARADGKLDAQEKQTITSEVQKAGLSPEGQRMVSEFLSEDVDPGKIARNITSSDEALQIYALSCAITRVDSAMERNYLDLLARSLRIPDATKTAIERKITG